MFRRVLVANRGEIAVRVIRALHELGIEAVAVYSTADADALHVRLADRAVRIGPPPAAQSYLSMPAIVAAAITTGCEAVHPGYGFLSENAGFVRACEENDLVFIGPPANVMEKMGDKARAKSEMRAAAVPLVPGTDGTASLIEARAAAGGACASSADRRSSTTPIREPPRRPKRRSRTARSTSRRRSRPRGTSRSR
jgi:acetyl/propionyl-CoA carboxylase alpha subunit